MRSVVERLRTSDRSKLILLDTSIEADCSPGAEDLDHLLDLVPDLGLDLDATAVIVNAVVAQVVSVLEARASSTASAPSHVDQRTAILERIVMMIVTIARTMDTIVVVMITTTSAPNLRAMARL